MAIKRQVNFLGNMRVDSPHLRLIESAVAADFQALSGVFMAGSRALIGSGVVLLDTGMVGKPADTLVLRMANTALLHGTAAEPGAIYTVPSTQADDTLGAGNAAVVGSFNSNSTNYIALGLLRTADPATQDTVIFRSTLTKLEFPQVVPLGRVLNYTINISTSNFGATPTLCPVAKVVTDANGNIVSIEDCRQMFFRLGSGGTTPNPLAQYVWANRNETTLATLFGGGDKDIVSQYDFNRAIEQRLWELGGGEHWYSPADDRSVKLVYTTASPWAWDGTNLTWSGLKFVFGNSTAQTNTVTDHAAPSAGFTNLADGEVIYVDLDRTVDGATLLTHKVLRTWLFANPPSIPGTRQILAWRVGAKVFAGEANNDVTVAVPLPIATNVINGGVLLNHASGTPLTPKVAVINASDWAVASGMDTLVAGGLFFGTVTATSLTFARAGVTSTFSGLLIGAAGIQGTGPANAAGVIGTGGAGDADGVTGHGTGNGHGVTGTLSATGTYAVYGTAAGATNGTGVYGLGKATGNGVHGKGGASGYGVVGEPDAAGTYGVFGDGTGATTDGGGVKGLGKGAGAGIFGTGGATGNGVEGVGGASGSGVKGTGKGAAGYGVLGVLHSTSAAAQAAVYGDATASAADGVGVRGLGKLAGAGVEGTGGATNAPGVKGTGTGNGVGVTGAGAGSGAGVEGHSTGSGPGVSGTGAGAGGGVVGVGGVTNGSIGVEGSSAATNGIGVKGLGSGTGQGVQGQGSGSGAGLYGFSATGPGVMVLANATRGALYCYPRNTPPSTPLVGDVYCDNSTSPAKFYGCVTDGAWTLMF